MQKKLFMGIFSLFALIAATAYVSKLYFSVENTLSKRCNEGGSASCYSLGILYENSSSAFDYFKKGCDNNHAQSCQYLGNLINATNDLTYMQKACEHNSARACFTLGEESKNADENSNVTVKYFKKSCENGDKKGCFELASIEYDRDNIEKSLYLFEELCEKNIYEACYRLGGIYKKSNVVKYPSRIDYAAKYYKLACEKGYIKESCEALENMNRHAQDIIKLRKLCSLNDSYSCNKLAEAYSSIDMAVDYSFIIAKKLYQKSCDELNDKEACLRVVDYCHWTSDEINEAKYAAKNCDEGVISHCATAARLYRYSEYSYNISLNNDTMDPFILTYVPKDINKAISYLLKACNKNSKEDCYELGDIYSVENEVKDTKKAAMYYKKACDIGYEPGCVKAANIKR